MNILNNKKMSIVAAIFAMLVVLIIVVILSGVDETSYTASLRSTVGEPRIENGLFVFSSLSLEDIEELESFRKFVEIGDPSDFAKEIRNKYNNNVSIYRIGGIKLETDIPYTNELIVDGALHNVAVYAIPEIRNTNTQYLVAHIENKEFTGNYNDVKRLLQFRSIEGGIEVPFNILLNIKNVQYVREEHATPEYYQDKI